MLVELNKSHLTICFSTQDQQAMLIRARRFCSTKNNRSLISCSSIIKPPVLWPFSDILVLSFSNSKKYYASLKLPLQQYDRWTDPTKKSHLVKLATKVNCTVVNYELEALTHSTKKCHHSLRLRAQKALSPLSKYKKENGTAIKNTSKSWIHKCNK